MNRDWQKIIIAVTLVLGPLGAGMNAWIGTWNGFAMSVVATALALWQLGAVASQGTRSVLYGYHAFYLHGFFVALGWLKLYGVERVKIGERIVFIDLPVLDARRKNRVTMTRGVFTSIFDPRLRIAFFLHDLGYLGKPNMDGAEGETHPEWAARVMKRLFGAEWGYLCLYHSRFYAKKFKGNPSALCYADKLAITYYPEWLMIRLVSWTGEVREYMKDSARQNAMRVSQCVDLVEIPHTEVLLWFRGVKTYVIQWVEEHKDGRADTWTPASGARAVVDQNGVWQ